MANGSEVEDFKPDRQIVVTDQMVAAGVAVLEAFEGEVSRPTLAGWVFEAMQSAARLGADQREMQASS